MQLLPVLEKDERLLSPTTWQADQELLVETPQGEQFIIDLTTNTVTPASTSAVSSTVTVPVTATDTVTQ